MRRIRSLEARDFISGSEARPAGQRSARSPADVLKEIDNRLGFLLDGGSRLPDPRPSRALRSPVERVNAFAWRARSGASSPGCSTSSTSLRSACTSGTTNAPAGDPRAPARRRQHRGGGRARRRRPSKRADYVVDFGPGAGRDRRRESSSRARPAQLRPFPGESRDRASTSPDGASIETRACVADTDRRRPGDPSKGPQEHNLQNVDAGDPPRDPDGRRHRGVRAPARATLVNGDPLTRPAPRVSTERRGPGKPARLRIEGLAPSTR